MTTAIDGGRMDGFDLMVTPDHDCAGPNYDCYQAFDPSQIPDLVALATSFAISDRTFQSDLAASWGSHLGLVSATLDGFNGDNPCASTQCPTLAPQPAPVTLGTGWGCDSHRDALWRRAADGHLTYQPACVPDPSLPLANGGAYRDASTVGFSAQRLRPAKGRDHPHEKQTQRKRNIETRATHLWIHQS